MYTNKIAPVHSPAFVCGARSIIIIHGNAGSFDSVGSRKIALRFFGCTNPCSDLHVTCTTPHGIYIYGCFVSFSRHKCIVFGAYFGKRTGFAAKIVFCVDTITWAMVENCALGSSAPIRLCSTCFGFVWRWILHADTDSSQQCAWKTNFDTFSPTFVWAQSACGRGNFSAKFVIVQSPPKPRKTSFYFTNSIIMSYKKIIYANHFDKQTLMEFLFVHFAGSWKHRAVAAATFSAAAFHRHRARPKTTWLRTSLAAMATHEMATVRLNFQRISHTYLELVIVRDHLLGPFHRNSSSCSVSFWTVQSFSILWSRLLIQFFCLVLYYWIFPVFVGKSFTNPVFLLKLWRFLCLCHFTRVFPMCS